MWNLGVELEENCFLWICLGMNLRFEKVHVLERVLKSLSFFSHMTAVPIILASWNDY